VGAALAGLGIAGLAIAFALQSILENFVAGLLLIFRKPFVAGDQIIVGEHEGTVADIDLRTTRIVRYDGELAIIPNATVFSESLINLTHSHRRRSGISVGIDYRDDHDAVADVVRRAVERTEGVLEDPGVLVVCRELGDSSVNFDVYYWTAPRITDVVLARDRVLRATKSALDANGFTIPWPIRTLVMDDVVKYRAADPA
jgi:small conductance mechanosensitive channel